MFECTFLNDLKLTCISTTRKPFTFFSKQVYLEKYNRSVEIVWQNKDRRKHIDIAQNLNKLVPGRYLSGFV